MTKLAARVLAHEIEAPDVLVGGTPCQAFSVAGLRQSLDDDRGQLTIKFLELADAIDNVRRTRGEPECIIVWENVPGVLSTKDNALGCFLAGLAGETEPLLPAGGKWSNAGCVFGPTRTVAWRVLDAQYFGVAQRRRRVFVIASARDDFNPAAVLFEFEGLRRDIAPSRTQRKDLAGGVAIGPSGGCLTDLNPTLDARAKDGPIRNQLAGALIPTSCWWDGGQISQTLDAVLHKGQTMPEKNRFPAVLQAVCVPDPAYCLSAGKQDKGGVFGSGRDGQDTFIIQPVPFRSPDADKSTGCGIGEEGEAMFTITTTNHHAVAAQGITLHGTNGTQSVASFTELSSSLRARIPSGVENSTTTAVLQSIAFEPGFLKREGTHFYHEHTGVIRSDPGDNAMAVACVDVAGTMTACKDSGGWSNSADHAAAGYMQPVGMQVRRLTPTECERLQGFPDGYTQVPHRGKPAADGPRYKALGNSMAVPVMKWIGERIKLYTEIEAKA
jgi:DNA (cytosine-5)-methyltransferase 1